MKRKILYTITGLFIFVSIFIGLFADAVGGNGNSSYFDNFGTENTANTNSSDYSNDLTYYGGELDEVVVTASAPSKSSNSGCNGIKLNTNFPIIGNCIKTSKDSKTNPTNAFPTMVGALTKIVMSVILVVCFILVIVAGIMWSAAGENNSRVTSAKKLITKVAITILLLGLSGVILKLVNPNFFG